MLHQKVSPPRTVTLEDGTVMTREDLPPQSTKRWTASRKEAVVQGVLYGLLPQEEARRCYQLSDQELRSWISAAQTHGTDALKATRLWVYR